MAFLTIGQAQAKSRTRYRNTRLAHDALVASAAVPQSTTFDIFLSHSSLDSEAIAGVALLLEEEGLSVYVDSIVDPQLNRESVTEQTAHLLRTRMVHSHFLLFATSTASPQSKWMPWELGYFDGSSAANKVGILPLVRTGGSNFIGQEYLSLYPSYEFLDFTAHGTRLGRMVDDSSGHLLLSDVRS